jgi:DNA invertase Pin-like site-specific DNA recombinase
MSGSQPLDTSTARGKASPRPSEKARYKDRAPTVRRQADEIVRLKKVGLSISPSEIASKLRIGRASVYRVLGEWSGERRRREANAHRVQGFGSSGVPQLLGSSLIDMP